ncbi:unnamed protein product [Urochloa humidicola]
MLRPLMLHRVGGEVHGTDIVAVDERALGEWAVELPQELTQPRRLCNAVSNGPVHRLGTGAGDDRLSLGGPRDKVAPKKDGVARGRATSVRTASPVSIRVDNQLGGGRPVKSKPVVNSAPEVAQEPLHSSEMRLPRIMHVKTDLLNSIGDIWPSESEVQQSSSNTLVGGPVSNRSTLSSRKLGQGVNRGGARLAVRHPSPLKNLKGILSLVKEETRRAGLNSNTQKVVEHTQILHSKLLL